MADILAPQSEKGRAAVAKRQAALATRIYESRMPSGDAVISSIKVPGRKPFTILMGIGTERLPVGTLVFDNVSGDEGVVVGRAERGGLFKTTEIIVRTSSRPEDVLTAPSRSLAVIKPPRQPKREKVRKEPAKRVVKAKAAPKKRKKVSRAKERPLTNAELRQLARLGALRAFRSR